MKFKAISSNESMLLNNYMIIEKEWGIHSFYYDN